LTELLYDRYETNDFVEVFKNLAGYRSKNNFFGKTILECRTFNLVDKISSFLQSTLKRFNNYFDDPTKLFSDL